MVTTLPVPVFSFSAEEFGRLFPFFVLIDPTGTIVEAGRSIRNLADTVKPGAPFSHAFTLKQPSAAFCFDRLRASCGQLYTLQEKTRGTLFRGQFQPIGGNLVFAGSLWVADTADLESLGLTLSDFAPHDPTLDLLQLVQTQKAVSGDLQDLTKRLGRQTAELEAAAQTKDAFLASMSHELRTPLTGILGLSETLLEGGAGAVNPQQTRYLQIIKTSGRRLLTLVNDILDLVKIASGQERPTRHTWPIAEICAASLEAIQPLVAKRRQHVTFEEETGGAFLEADGRRLTQALDNLLNNASKFTPEGGEFGLRTFLRNNAVHFEVWDRGIGIAGVDIDRLFQPFAQLDARLSRRYEGVGLGLALAKLLIEMHGGSIAVDSTPLRGSRFTISLPRESEKKVQ